MSGNIRWPKKRPNLWTFRWQNTCAGRSARRSPRLALVRGCAMPVSWNPAIAVPASRLTRSSMARKTEAYVDTSGFIAFLDKSDSYHSLYRRLFSEPLALVTSALVIAEGHGWFLRRYDQYRAVQFLAFVEVLPGLTIEAFDADGLVQTSRIVK